MKKSEIEETEMEITSNSDIEEVFNDILEKTPEISEHVISQETEKAEENQQFIELYEGFDPAIHRVDENGKPIPLASGGWSRIRKKRTTEQGNSQLGKVHANVDKEMKTRQAAKAATLLTFQVGMILGGEEWQPEVDQQTGVNEPFQLESAYAGYFATKEITDIPAGFALTLALIAYAAPRFTQPKTKTRLQKFSLFCKEKISNYRSKKKPLKIEPEKQEQKNPDAVAGLRG